jgi:hypothetical protein
MMQRIPNTLPNQETVVLDKMCSNCQKRAIGNLINPQIPRDSKKDDWKILFCAEILHITENCPKCQKIIINELESYMDEKYWSV